VYSLGGLNGINLRVILPFSIIAVFLELLRRNNFHGDTRDVFVGNGYLGGFRVSRLRRFGSISLILYPAVVIFSVLLLFLQILGHFISHTSLAEYFFHHLTPGTP